MEEMVIDKLYERMIMVMLGFFVGLLVMALLGIAMERRYSVFESKTTAHDVKVSAFIACFGVGLKVAKTNEEISFFDKECYKESEKVSEIFKDK